MPQILQQFFSLLRAGLWEEHMPDTSLFKGDVNWVAIYKLSQEQTVVAVVWDGIEKLPLELRPDKALTFKWYGFIVRNEQTNRVINSRVAEIFELYKSAGLHPILLKGAGIASLYRNPLRRGCGDIDIFVGGDKECEIANKVVVDKLQSINLNALGKEHKHDFHTTLKLPDGLTIENHTRVTSHFTTSISHRFDNQLNSWYPDNPGYADIADHKIEVPPSDFNTQYVFIHMYRHFFSVGVGLRQMCDWAVLINRLGQQNIELVGYKQGWQVMAGFLVEYLGIDPAKIPHFKGVNSKKNRIVLDLILESGNFGHQLLNKRPSGYWSGKIYSFRRQITRWPRLTSISFADTFNYLVFKRLKDIGAYIVELFTGHSSRK